jgi:RNA polymerase sigma factor (sigma-70 family)
VLRSNEAHLLDDARQGDRSAREQLVVEHLGDVRSIAARYRNLGLPLDDLVQEGSLGLLDAIEHYDHERQTDFDVYARFRIRRAIRNALTEKSRLIRLPKEVVERRRAVARAEERLTQSDGSPPSAGELAEVTGLSVDTVLDTRTIAPGVVSLDQVVLPDGSTLESLIEDGTSPDPVVDTVEQEQAALVDRAVADLPDRQREILCRHFGLGRPPEEIAEVAADLHVSQQRARTIERDALFTLRDRLERQLQRKPFRRR